jgi:hypothetical protein
MQIINQSNFLKYSMEKHTYKSIIAFCLIALLGTGCFKDEDFNFDKIRLVEFEDAVRLTPPAGFSYGVITVTRTTASRNFQVNLVGKQLEAPETIRFSVDTAISRFLNATTIRAVEGVHYDLQGGNLNFEVAKSTANVTLRLPANIPQNTGRTALLVLKLDGNDNIKPSENYRRIGVRINLN